jgi:exodeoxyribonuclease-3
LIFWINISGMSPSKIRLASWNVNGLRAVHKKTFPSWFASESADIVCLQEIKCSREQVAGDEELTHPSGYFSHFHSAQKPGYSGLAIYSRREPLDVREGIGRDEFDAEGRWLEVDYQLSDFQKGSSSTITVINSYWPNSQRDHTRLPFKLDFCSAAEKRLEDLRREGRQVVICGDFNIAHKEIDLKNPKTNINNAGFLPEERAWMDRFTSLGWVDTFRSLNSDPGHYTWWSYRPGVREKNIGWRLDYFFMNPEWSDRLLSVDDLPHILGSDHCPVRFEFR